MGGTYMAETATGCGAAEAHTAMLEHFRSEGYTETESDDWDDDSPTPWPDLFCKGWRQVWDKPVDECAVSWMRGWTAQHPREGVDPDDKWGPWLAFPLAAGGWHFFGWVNT